MTKKTQQIWLARHAETEWSLSGQHTGRTDIPLTEQGRRKTAALAKFLEGRDFELILCSPLSRARETCRLAGLEPRAEILPDLREWDYGVYEGRTTADIREEVPGWSVWTHEIAGGESLEQVANRAHNVIERIANSNGNAVVFSHGHFLRILAATWIGMAPNAARRLALSTGSLSILGYEHETRVLQRWNVAPGS